MKIAIYYSAENKDIIVVAGEVAETGAQAFCISGTDDVPKLDIEEQALAVVDSILHDVSNAGELVFLIHGGTLNNDLSEQPYKLLGVYDA